MGAFYLDSLGFGFLFADISGKFQQLAGKHLVYPPIILYTILIKLHPAKKILLNDLILQTDFASLHILANKFCKINRILKISVVAN